MRHHALTPLILAAALSISILNSGCGSGSSQNAGGSSTGSAAVSLSASSLSFATAVGATSASQNVGVSNTGTAALSIGSISLAGANASSFSQTNTCGASLAAGAACNVAVSFAPSAAGSYGATLNIADSVSGSPQVVTLTGVGDAPVLGLSSTSLSFSTNFGTTAGPQVLVLTNTGNAPLSVTGIDLGGTNATSFNETNNCSSVAAGSSCNVTVTFTGMALGSYSASLSIADNGSGSPQSVALAGTVGGAAITLSSTQLSFTAAAESTSAAQTVTLQNTGNATLMLNSVGLTGAAASFAQTNTCGTSVAAGASCTITLTFTPFLATSYSAALAITSNALPATQTIGLSGTGTGTLSINTSNASDWIITNGALTLNWNSTTGNVWGVQLAGYPDQLVDTTTRSSNGQPDGLYMDNTGPGAGTPTSGYSQIGNEYIDWWIAVPSSASNAFTTTEHFVLTANDTGFHVYSTVGHSATDIAGSIGQWQYVFRINLAQFTDTYTVNEGLGNMGVSDVPQPSTADTGSTDPGRQVENAVVDLHGFTLPSGFTREFYTKYDYASYEYLHQEHGVYGSTYGAWTVIPSAESLVGGPTKQDLIFTNNILMMEALSSHLDNELAYTPPQGVATNRLFGPYYFHFNAFNATNTTPAALYQEAQTWLPQFNSLYDTDGTLASSGYVASTARGGVNSTIAGTGATTPYRAWTVLGDNSTNFQYSNAGRQYWANNSSTAEANFTGVAPGTYRLSSYVLGEWGELRVNNVAVAANSTTNAGALTFTPENFGASAPIWTIGIPDRSGHEFLHGHDGLGNDLRNYWGAYNYWQDFAANQGGEVYYATAEGLTPASDSLDLINYVQWGTFDPGLYAGIYSASDDTTDGYNYIVPSYVGAANVATTRSPGLTIHFMTTAAQQAQGQYVVLSVALACVEGSVVPTLNNKQLVWHYLNSSDCMVRSGLSGYTQWIAFEWPTSDLKPAGQDNVLTLGVSQVDGVMLDALRMEITNTSADPAVTGWNDYEYVDSSKYTPANDALANP